MDFLQLKDKCIANKDKVFDAICNDDTQRDALLKALKLIFDSHYESKACDEHTAQLLLNSALIVVGSVFTKAMELTLVVLNQIKSEIVGCIEAYDSTDKGCIRYLTNKQMYDDVDDMILARMKLEYLALVESLQKVVAEYEACLRNDNRKVLMI